jgi:very-short-patch-repair endonuclease
MSKWARSLNAKLAKAGWRVIRLPEADIKQDATVCAHLVAATPVPAHILTRLQSLVA